MSSEYIAFGIVGTAIGAIATITGIVVQAWVSSRRESGTVTTADAQTLFGASNTLIQSLMHAQEKLTGRLDELSRRFDTVLERVERLIAQQDELLKLQREQCRTLHEIEQKEEEKWPAT